MVDFTYLGDVSNLLTVRGEINHLLSSMDIPVSCFSSKKKKSAPLRVRIEAEDPLMPWTALALDVDGCGPPMTGRNDGESDGMVEHTFRTKKNYGFFCLMAMYLLSKFGYLGGICVKFRGGTPPEVWQFALQKKWGSRCEFCPFPLRIRFPFLEVKC